MLKQIVALSGPRCCGKSTIAKHLVANHGYTRIAFADALREIAETAGPDFANDRLYLARLGDKLRSQVPDFLIQVVNNRLELTHGPVVIEDIRFPAEVEFCQSIGAATIRLEIPIETQRERLVKRDGKEGHESELLIACMDERAVDDVIDWDYRIPAIGDFRELALAINMGNLQDSRAPTNSSKEARV